MDRGDVIRNHLAGAPGEQGRREELVQALLDAFARGGAEAVASEITSSLDTLEQAFVVKLQALSELLS